MGLDCQNFLRTLANTLSTKNNEPYASVISYIKLEVIIDYGSAFVRAYGKITETMAKINRGR